MTTTDYADATAAEMAPFFPPADAGRAMAGARTHAGLTYASIDGYRHLKLDLHVPMDVEKSVAVVVWIHGGAFSMGARDILPAGWPVDGVAKALIGAGIAAATIDYRHSREAGFPAQLHDVKAAIRYLRGFADELRLDANRVGV
nr:alpha/beta hydrolase fold domain-containing protein [Propionicimonas sp.]